MCIRDSLCAVLYADNGLWDSVRCVCNRRESFDPCRRKPNLCDDQYCFRGGAQYFSGCLFYFWAEYGNCRGGAGHLDWTGCFLLPGNRLSDPVSKYSFYQGAFSSKCGAGLGDLLTGGAVSYTHLMMIISLTGSVLEHSG